MSNEESRFKFKTIDELQAEWEKPWDSAEKRRHEESNYRRGYRDGYIQAVTRFYELMFEHRLSRDNAYDALWTHWERALSAWEMADDGSVILPPECPKPEKENAR